MVKIAHEEAKEANSAISKASDSPSDGCDVPSDEFEDATEETTVIVRTSMKNSRKSNAMQSLTAQSKPSTIEEELSIASSMFLSCLGDNKD